MKLLLAGLAAREQAALELFLRREEPDWTFQSVPADPPTAGPNWPAADLIILDLAAFGWAQASAVHAAQIAQRCAHTPALLLVAAHDTEWAALRGQIQRPDWIWLGKPYSAQAMLDALSEAVQRQARAAAEQQRAQRLAQQRAARLEHEQNKPDSPVGRAQVAIDSIANEAPLDPPPQRALQSVPPLDAFHTAPAIPVTPAQPAAPRRADLAQAACARLARALVDSPADAAQLARSVLAGCAAQTPFELRFTLNHSVLIDPVAGWVAGNTPEVVVRQVARSDTLARAISLRPWPDAAQARARVAQMGWTPTDLAPWLDLLAVESPR